MKFTCDRKLLEVISQAATNFTESTAKTNLNNIALIVADTGFQELKVRITPDSRLVEFEITVAAEVLESGKVLIDLRRLASYLSSLKTEKIEANLSGSKIEITSPGSNIAFAIAQVENYEPFPTEILDSISKIKVGVFHTAVSAVLATADTSNNITSGIQLRMSEDLEKGIVASTDGKRISEYFFAIEEGDATKALVIPKVIANKCLSFLNKLVPRQITSTLKWGDNLFELTGNYIVNADMGEFVIRGRVLDYFPPYSTALENYDEEDVYKLVLEKEPTVEAIHRINCLLDTNKQVIPFAKFTYIFGSQLLIEFESEMGKSLEILDKVEGNKSFSFYANPIYFLEGLREIHTKNFELRAINNIKPISLRPFESLTGFQYFFFPINYGTF